MDAKRQKKFRIFLFSKRSHAGKVTAGGSNQLRATPPPTTFITNPEKTNKSKEHPPTPYFHMLSPSAQPATHKKRSHEISWNICEIQHNFYASWFLTTLCAEKCKEQPESFSLRLQGNLGHTRSTPLQQEERGTNFHKNFPTHSNNILAPKNNPKACVTYNPTSKARFYSLSIFYNIPRR